MAYLKPARVMQKRPTQQPLRQSQPLSRPTKKQQPLNSQMSIYRKQQQSKGAKFNSRGEMTTKPTKAQVAAFNKRFTTYK